MIFAAAIIAASVKAQEVAYCVQNGIPVPEPSEVSKGPADNSANSPWMWLPMFLAGLL